MQMKELERQHQLQEKERERERKRARERVLERILQTMALEKDDVLSQSTKACDRSFSVGYQKKRNVSDRADPMSETQKST